MQPVKCAAGMVEPALGAAAGMGRWFVGGGVLPVCGDFHRRTPHSAITTHTTLSVCEWPALGMPWGTAVSNAASIVRSSCGGACTGAAAGLGRWLVGVVVLPVCGDFHRRRQHSATAAHRDLPVCEWPNSNWACHGVLQGQMKLLQCASGEVEP